MTDAGQMIASPGPPPGPPPGPLGPPGPPPGPGVQPPFVAAPIEGRRARTWLSLGVAGGLLAACCGVGGVAIGGLLVLGNEAVNEQAQTAADDYLAAVVAQDWEQAYGLRCEDDREAQSLAEFAQRESAQPRIQSYEVGDLYQTGDLDDPNLRVPAQVVYADSSQDTLAMPVEQNDLGQFEVCFAGDPGV